MKGLKIVAGLGAAIILTACGSSAGSSGALKFAHQPASGQIGASLTTGAVKAVGTSPGRSSAVGLGVEQPAAVRASTLTDR